MAKIWCDNCDGMGLVESLSYSEVSDEQSEDCCVCHGAGYTEQYVVAVSEIRQALKDTCAQCVGTRRPRISYFADWLDQKEKESKR